MVPVSVRAESERGALGNRVSTMYAPLPIGVEDPIARFRAVHEAMRGLKESGQAVGAEMLTSLADFAPPTILSQAARLQAVQRFFNLTVTNVPGPQFPLYLLGRRLRAHLPAGAAGGELHARASRSCPTTGGSTSGWWPTTTRCPTSTTLAAASRRRSRELAAVAGTAQQSPNGRSRRPAKPPGGRHAPMNPLPPLTLALAQVDARVGDIDGNARARARADRPRARRRRGAGAPARARADRLPARGPAAQGALPARRRRRRSRELAAETRGIVAMVGFPERTEDVYNALAVLADGAVATIYRKTLPAQLRRVRRAALLPGRRGRGRARPRERADRADDLRGHLERRAIPRRGGARGRDAARQRVGLAVPRGQGPPSASGC